jgi:hypothetical protein
MVKGFEITTIVISDRGQYQIHAFAAISWRESNASGES